MALFALARPITGGLVGMRIEPNGARSRPLLALARHSSMSGRWAALRGIADVAAGSAESTSWAPGLNHKKMLVDQGSTNGLERGHQRTDFDAGLAALPHFTTRLPSRREPST